VAPNLWKVSVQSGEVALVRNHVRQKVNSEDRRGVAALVKSWVNKNKNFFWICIILAAVFSIVWPVSENPNLVLVLFVCCLLIAYLGREVESRDEKLLSARCVLLDIAFQECRCESAPKGYEGCCNVCGARAVLKAQFPGAIEFRIRELLGQWPRFEHSGSVSYIANPLLIFDSEWGHIPEDLAASYLTPDELPWAKELERKWLETHQAKPQ
jgi:hypothetical protein